MVLKKHLKIDILNNEVLNNGIINCLPNLNLIILVNISESQKNSLKTNYSR